MLPATAETTSLENVVTTFLFTDMEDSTGHWQRAPAEMRALTEHHDRIIRDAIATHGGRIFRIEGDAFKVAYLEAAAAIKTALQAQQALLTLMLSGQYTVPLRVRMALHTGPVQHRDGDYYGLAPAGAARLLDVAHGGQVLLTGAAKDACAEDLPEDAVLFDHGEHTLRSFTEPFPIYQMLHPEMASELARPKFANLAPNNLPRQMTPFIGRNREIADLRRLLTTRPLVTLHGAGGCGKTRLSVEVARYVQSQFKDGQWFLELAPVQNAIYIPSMLARILALQLKRNVDILEQVIAALRGKKTLLIVDNCEHLLEPLGELVERLLRELPDLQILATSREPLQVFGETLYPVNPLPVPSEDANISARQAFSVESARLFEDRVAAQMPAFRLTDETAPLIARICRRLEGIPLALILVAAWVHSLGLAQLEQQIHERVHLLTAPGPRMPTAHHRTLWQTIDWSYSRLTEAEKRLFRRLAVFVGGWQAEAIPAVCDLSAEDTPALLASLTQKSLVSELEERSETKDDWQHATPDTQYLKPDTMRYQMLEAIRQFALEKLQADDDSTGAIRRHQVYFAKWAETIGPLLEGDRAEVGLRHVDRELKNLRAALETTTDTTTGVQFIAGLFWFWHLRGLHQEATVFCQRFLDPANFGDILHTMALPESLRKVWAKAFNGAGILYWDQKILEEARAMLEASRALYQQLGDLNGLQGVTSNLGGVAGQQGRYTESRQLLEESRQLCYQTDNRARLGTVVTNLGTLTSRQGDRDTAIMYYREALAIHREFQNWVSVAIVLHNLAFEFLLREAIPECIQYTLESLHLRHRLNHRPGLANTLDLLPFIAEKQGDFESAARLLSFAETFRQTEQLPRLSSSLDQPQLRERLKNILGENRLFALEIQGKHDTIESAVRLVSQDSPVQTADIAEEMNDGDV